MRKRYYGSNSNPKQELIVSLVMVAIILSLVVLVIGLPGYFGEKEYTITITDKNIKNYDGSSKFLVFTKTDKGATRVFEVTDTIVKGRWNSADDYAELEIGKTYDVDVIGWRIPLLSQYENIIDFDIVNE